jgi:hypothetical protein
MAADWRIGQRPNMKFSGLCGLIDLSQPGFALIPRQPQGEN